MTRIGFHVGQDWWTFLNTYDDHGPILDIAAGSAAVTFCFDGSQVTAAAVEFTRCRRPGAVPPVRLPVWDETSATYLDPATGDGGLVFVGPKGGRLRRSNFRKFWNRARGAVGLPELHFHDLRHTGNTMAAAQGASLRELMERMGHSSTPAALIYLHATRERDEAIAAGMGRPPLCQDQVRHQGQPLLVELEG